MRWRWLAAVVVVASVGVSASGCSESSSDQGPARNAAVLEEIIRTVVDEVPADPEDPDALPVVFVVGTDPIGIETQAAVVASLVDDVDVRFADERAEALDESLEGSPVREDGTLLVLSPVPADRRAIDVEVERYRSIDDTERLGLTLVWRDQIWSVTATTVVPPVGG